MNKFKVQFGLFCIFLENLILQRAAAGGVVEEQSLNARRGAVLASPPRPYNKPPQVS